MQIRILTMANFEFYFAVLLETSPMGVTCHTKTSPLLRSCILFSLLHLSITSDLASESESRWRNLFYADFWHLLVFFVVRLWLSNFLGRDLNDDFTREYLQFLLLLVQDDCISMRVFAMFTGNSRIAES